MFRKYNDIMISEDDDDKNNNKVDNSICWLGISATK